MTTTKVSVQVPEVMRGQVLTQLGGYFVRGQYVVGYDRKLVDHANGRGAWFWYDMYNRRNAEYGLPNAQAALDTLAEYLGSKA